MNITKCSIEGVRIIEPDVYEDERGFFYESYHQEKYKNLINIKENFVQDNHSKSSYGVLRGLHFQKNQAQGKLIRVIQGNVYDFFIDIRQESETFGKAFGIEISEKNKLQVWLPPGLAHGFLTLSPFAEFEYKCTNFYDPNDEHCLIWTDPQINLKLPIPKGDIIVSQKDLNGLTFDELITKGII
ncbi:MAG: dTDP-4-dehydrorhamnose 3,5-epimerase [Flavobacteriaceae bacterium]|nr:dTDP-4-dehydrorhamnose 3,5-epimerase [Flavobacteriaceae bacterium]